jgi:hypothetical protein
MHITKQCTIKFAISSKYVDEVTCDVVSLRECGMVLGSPYLYDRKAIFYRTKNQYQLTKAGQDYVVHAHHVKANMIQNRIQEPDRAQKGSKMKVLRIRRNQRHCVRLVLPIPAIYLLSQTDVVCESYRTLTIFPNREKVNRSSQMMTSA